MLRAILYSFERVAVQNVLISSSIICEVGSSVHISYDATQDMPHSGFLKFHFTGTFWDDEKVARVVCSIQLSRCRVRT